VTSRLLLFGIDAATLDLAGPWAERGDLPVLGRLLRDGAGGRLRSVPNMITPAAWPSLATGCNPGKHGIFYFTERVPGSYGERFVNGSARALPAFWTLLEPAGVSCAVINAPMTYPAEPLRGAVVAGMDAPSARVPGFTHPPDLAAALVERFGEMAEPGGLTGKIGHLFLAGRIEESLEILERRVAARTEMARFVLDRHPADAVFLVHMEVDAVQHYFWRFIDPRARGYSERDALRYGDGILRVYQAVDRSLDALIEAFKPSAVLVASDHGAGASPGPEDGVPWIRLVLETMGWSAQARADRAGRRALARLYRAVNPRLPRGVRQALKRWLPGVSDTAKASVKYRHDWARTKAFCMGASGEVWLNVRGRDPDGVVEPGDEYDRLRREIRATFLALREGSTGEPVVETVDFRDEVYQGPFVERAPDLFVRFRDVVIGTLALNGSVLRLPRPGAAVPKEVKTGSHRPDGLIVMAGPGVAPGARLEGARLIDVAPTLLYWLDQPVPAHMDGAVLAGAFAPEWLAAHPARQVAVPTDGARAAQAAYSEDEEALVMERLRDLGYV
jgi:predicted AlkP superfamily phosphohydrolase/phosphomutase